MRTDKTLLDDMKCGIDHINSPQHDVQYEPKFTNSPSRELSNADNSSWNILARALARERASTLKDDNSKAQGAEMLKDDTEATNASPPPILPPRNQDNSWAILATALAKERECQLHLGIQKRLLQKSRDVVRKEYSPGKSIEDTTCSGELSGENDPGARKEPSASSKGKESYKAREFKAASTKDKVYHRRWQRKYIHGHEVANPVPTNFKTEAESLSPRVSVFVSSVLDSFLREEEHALRRSPIAAVSATDAKSRFLNRWKNVQVSVSGAPSHFQRSHDSGPEWLSSPARPNSPRSYGKVEADFIPRMSPFVSSILDSFLRGEEYALRKSPIAAGLLVGHAKSRLRSRRKNEGTMLDVPDYHCQHAGDSGPEMFLCSTFSSPRKAEPQTHPTARAPHKTRDGRKAWKGPT